MGSLALRPGDSLTTLEDGFVNRLQNGKFPPHPAIQATGPGLLPRRDFHPLFMPAFAGRTLIAVSYTHLSNQHSARFSCATTPRATPLSTGARQSDFPAFWSISATYAQLGIQELEVSESSLKIVSELQLGQCSAKAIQSLIGEMNRRLPISSARSKRCSRSVCVHFDFGPVSYTHLDVYKRQASRSAHRRCGLSETVPSRASGE